MCQYYVNIRVGGRKSEKLKSRLKSKMDYRKDFLIFRSSAVEKICLKPRTILQFASSTRRREKYARFLLTKYINPATAARPRKASASDSSATILRPEKTTLSEMDTFGYFYTFDLELGNSSKSFVSSDTVENKRFLSSYKLLLSPKLLK